ncbi:hypothetical protein GCM10011487_64490 [Steroidobacter agaridevorans]|uniref:DUF885 domain-containing protein n=1 Tax=Steroidobacter agaridevorans TaxID=2695856 RepID=A0A829YMR1_9GAMM|nr:DUF885 family protein [Steroidobacter agaridevorans]GFE84449.1 hypothetical protein GCM10011487_64490 [Steroidobacter agaridevorans]
MNRRILLRAAVGASLAAFSGLPAFAANSTSPALDALLQRLAEDYLRRSPEQATQYEFDVGANASLRAQLDDRSLAATARDHESATRTLAELAKIDRAKLDAAAQLDYDTAVFVYSMLKDLTGRYGTMDIDLRPSPFPVSQMNGTYYWLPEFLGSRHPLESAQDVDAYFSRMSALARALDQETERIRHDAGIGVIPPSFVIKRTLAQIQTLRDTPPAQTAMIGPAIERAHGKKLGDIGPRAEKIFRSQIVPALNRQMQALEALAPKAKASAGVWALPDGEAYYAASVHSNTTTKIEPGELHKRGLQLVADISAQLDRSLKEQGLKSGPIGERIKALDADPRFLVPENDAGREQLLTAARNDIAAIRALLPKGFKTIPKDELLVKRIPVAIENGAPDAFYSDGVGDQPGTFSLNLKSTAELPLWRLPTLAHHEGIPGHHFQFAVLRAAGELSLFRRLVRFSAYTEGWALYAERVADELGIYEKNPAGRVGLLQSELFRAARIVVDTGIHHHRWTREQAVQWMVENAGERQMSSEREIDRYCVYPGQACSFMVGATGIRAARERARQQMGNRFDVRLYHDLVLTSGPVPIDVLHAAVDQWSKTAPG